MDALSIAMNAEANLGNLREALSCAEQCLDATEDDAGVEYVNCVAAIAWVTALLGDVDRAEAAIADAVAGLERLRINTAAAERLADELEDALRVPTPS